MQQAFRKHSLLQLREKCGIAAATIGSQWQVEFLSRDQRWVEMRYVVDQFTSWNEERKEMYYRAGGKLIAFFKNQIR